MSLATRWMPLPVPLALVVAGAALALATDQPSKLHCPMKAPKDQCSEHSSTRFIVNGSSVNFMYEVNNFITLKCSNDLQLDSVRAYLPQFTPALHVGNVTVEDCPPAHYATLLAAFNVTTTSPFDLELHDVRRNEPLAAEHFTDLPLLRHLTLLQAGVLHGLPASLEGLTSLTIEYTELLDDTLEALPRTLTELRLKEGNITIVPAAVLDLPELRSLYVEFLVMRNQVVEVERSDTLRLRQLYVSLADAELMSNWAPPALQEVTLCGWQALMPNPIPTCDNLVKLTLYEPYVTKLPDGWVAHCPQLKELLIIGVDVVMKLPARLLENATQLTTLGIHNRLSTLPAQLFAYTPNLTHLDLSYNHLYQLPSSMLTLPLLSLDLEGNRFNTSVVAELASLTELRSLTLAENPGLGDLCAVNDSYFTEHKSMKSSLASLSKLERLDLEGTNISVICSDWREDMVNLKYLDLSDSKLGNLTYEDLQFKRSVPTEVMLSGRISFTADDYDRAAAAADMAAKSCHPLTHNVMLTITAYNDCNLYWITKALNDKLLPLYEVYLDDNRGDIKLLSTVRAEDLLCPSREMCAAVPSSCYCGMAGEGLLRIVCVGVKLDRMPQLPSLNNDTNVHAVDLVLSNNSITELVVDDLPPHLRVLDLRNNSISYMSEVTARALVSGTKRSVLLAGNRLECSCRATPALRVLRNRVARAVLVGYDALRCVDGGTLEDAINNACPTTTQPPPTVPSASPNSSAMWSVTFAAVLVGVGVTVLAGCLWWKGHKNFLGHTRALLWRLGWTFGDAPAAAWWSDAFVMFGHGDERPALELTARLEHGPTPRRVCLAERDWLPPALLSDCMTLSARTARYTVALVSPECERSLDLDEIRAVARRGALVLVLPPAGELEDAALRRYAIDYPHMVLRRDAPDFWRRLERVVPVSPPTPVSPQTAVSPPTPVSPQTPVSPPTPASPPSEHIPLVPLTPHR